MMRTKTWLSKELLEMALASSGDTVWDWNLKTGKIELDDNWIKFLGYDPERFEFSFVWWQECIHPDSIDVFEKALSAYLEGKKKFYEIEYQIRTRKGNWIWVWAIGKCVKYDRDGSPLRFIGTHRDITHRKKVEMELVEIKNKLEIKVKERTLELEKSNMELIAALKEIKTLQGIIPICSICKKIRDKTGSWKQLEEYIHKHSDAEFSHGVCPECSQKHYSEFHGPEN